MFSISACYAQFKREKNSNWESGIAVTTAHGLSVVIAIFPEDATTPIDIPADIWDYRLDWTHSLDGSLMDSLHPRK